jgi:4-diphosphocytidyl-2-C-methyl-D-erythritol kinase
MRVARVLAQAKVNLFLRVGAPDESGYHEIATIFQRLDLADEIVVRAGGNVRALDCSGPQLPSDGLGAPENNLAFRAAVSYAEQTGWPRGFSIELTKNIPVGGGLGGGSADAAALLRALEAMASQPIGGDALREIGGSLGSDVPFLASEHVAALAWGRGEKLHPIEPLAARDVLVVVPDFAVSTADAYRWLDEARLDTQEHALPPLMSLKGLSIWETHDLLSENDFEPVVEENHPELRRFRERLASLGARVARLSGSGSCVFGIFEGPAPSARDVALDALVIPTRTSSRVVQVEVLE